MTAGWGRADNHINCSRSVKIRVLVLYRNGYIIDP